MPNDIIADLPSVISDHIDACNNHAIDAWMATFAKGAVVNDVQREFAGAEAIRTFAQREIFGASVTMAVQDALDREGNITVHAHIDGSYDKTGLPDPLILTFYFSVRDGKITQLIIVHNKSIA